MRLWRIVFEALHTSFPTAVLITLAYIIADIIAEPFGEGQWGVALALFMFAGIVTAFIMYSLALLAKWAFMGVYKPLMKPMWSWWAMRTEAVAVFYGGLASKVLLEYPPRHALPALAAAGRLEPRSARAPGSTPPISPSSTASRSAITR